jgi:hypothetical protein
MIDKKLIISRKINSVSLGAECMYVRILLLTDDFGRYHADPRILKAHAFSLRGVTNKTILKWLSELVEIGLVKLYSVGDEEYLEIVRFEDFQTFRGDRKRQEGFPKPRKYHQCPTSDIPPGDCSLIKVNRSKVNLIKENAIRSCSDPKCQNLEHWECQFNHYWDSFPNSIGKVDTHSLFLTICRKGEIKELIKGLDGYIEMLNYKRIHENFKQAPMNSARFLRKENWREFIGFKNKPSL